MEQNRARITIKLGSRSSDHAAEDKHIQKEKKILQHKTKDSSLEQPSVEEGLAVGRGESDRIEEDDLFGPKYVSSENRHRLSIWKRKRKKASQPSWSRTGSGKGAFNILISAAGAIALGMIFGFMILHFFQLGFIDGGSRSEPIPVQSPLEDSGMISGEKDLKSGAMESDAAPSHTAGENPAGTSVSRTASVMITTPGRNYFAVQAGVFHDQQSANPILEKIKGKGWPHAFIGESPQFLFLGIALNRDHVLAIANQYKDIDIFIKEYSEPIRTISVPLLEGKTSGQEEWDQWLDTEGKFLESLGKGISEGLASNKLSEETFKEIISYHRQFLEQGRELMNKLPEANQAVGSGWLNDFTRGVTAIERFYKQPSQGYVWQAEQALLDVQRSREKWIQSFSER